MRPQTNSAVSPTIVVGLHGTCWLYPDGTTYGGGQASHRDPDADSVDETPVRTVEQMLAELGDVATALRWARDNAHVRFAKPERRAAEGSGGEPLDVLEWSTGLSLGQWREFAGMYRVELGEEDRPLRGQYQDGDVWEVYADGMEWNVGGVTRVDHADLEISFERVEDR